ncbi:MAG: hypothetical protein J0I47_05295 [Sphingomonas sp.]|uniref:hypothetical protein n=1 Tax=Sphingomonas sp. TaxID=28214 RepID=UPI001ACD49FB|nr:hypothetical protein [Sphingomonas sp.]MBN8807640.1 hypothetical protein [Sphingomonas sp.]
MRIFRADRAGIALAVALGGGGLIAGWPALGQQKPESILPPGFDQPTSAPTPSRPRATPSRPVPVATASATPASPATVPGTPLAATSTPLPSATPSPVATDPLTGLPIGQPAAGPVHYVLPAGSRRSLDLIGIVPPDRMMNPAAFGSADGRYIAGLMQATRAPVASRWVSIALRRMLAQPLATPRNVGGADFAAERAWLLLRMGESDLARAIVQAVDPDNYSPRLYDVAMQAALATGDIGAMCPLATTAVTVTDDPSWVLARAMCAGLGSSPTTAPPLMNQAKRIAGGVDLLLAQKIAGRASNRQDITIEWQSVPSLTMWRYGLATALGETIPDELFAGLGPQVAYWRALSPRLTPVARAPFAELAAAQGVLSNAALVDLYGAVDAGDETGVTANAVANDVRNAYVANSRDGRLDALRTLWKGADAGEAAHYGRYVLTARAASRIPLADKTDDSDTLIAAMLSAGFDGRAAEWRGSVGRGSLGWALIALSDPESQQRYSSSDVGAFGSDARKQRMFAAGLAGLGRLDASVAQSYGVDVAGENAWTKAIDRAAAEGRPGEVLILCATGMQTNDWRAVPAQGLFHIVNALRVVGLGAMARMVATEAVTRA